MKNLFFILLLVTGFSINSDAQDLDYYLYNVSLTETWNFAMDDASIMPAQYEFGMGTGLTMGTYGSTFTLPLEWKAEDSSGCWVTSVITTAPSGGSVTTSCGTTVYFGFQQSAPFLYEMKMQFP